MFNANGDAPLYAARAWLSFGNIQVSGTYTQTLTTITVTATAHNLAVGNLVYLTVSSGLATSGWYTVATVSTVNIFTVESTVSQTTSGNIIKNLAIYGSGNIASITDDGVGLFTISFITPMPSVNYVPVGSAVGTNTQQPVFKVIGTAATVAPTTKTVSAIQLGMAYGGTTTDSNNMYLAFIGG